MNKLVYLTVFAVCVAVSCRIIPVVQAAPSADSSEQLLASHAAHRVVRQAPDSPETTPPPAPVNWSEDYSRNKREAKGGGSMPTRKG